jgi:DNA-binding IclR family transcriptional regulator
MNAKSQDMLKKSAFALLVALNENAAGAMVSEIIAIFAAFGATTAQIQTLVDSLEAVGYVNNTAGRVTITDTGRKILA